MNRIKWIFLSLCNAKKALKKKSSMKKVVIRIVVLLVAFYLCKSLHYQFPMRTVPRDIDLWIWWQNWNSCNIPSSFTRLLFNSCRRKLWYCSARLACQISLFHSILPGQWMKAICCIQYSSPSWIHYSWLLSLWCVVWKQNQFLFAAR